MIATKLWSWLNLHNCGLLEVNRGEREKERTLSRLQSDPRGCDLQHTAPSLQGCLGVLFCFVFCFGYCKLVVTFVVLLLPSSAITIQIYITLHLHHKRQSGYYESHVLVKQTEAFKD